jgi:hypothetical protein
MHTLPAVLEALAVHDCVDGGGDGKRRALAAAQAARNSSAASRLQRKQGRWPAERATASSRKKSWVQLRPAMTERRHPLFTHELVVHRLVSRVFVAGSWMMPRLPVNMSRCEMATISPKSVTRF